MVHQGHERLLQLGPELEHELVVGVDGEGGRHEAHVQRATEGHEHVDRPLVVQAHDGIHALGKLGADWEEKNKGRKGGMEVLAIKRGRLCCYRVLADPVGPPRPVGKNTWFHSTLQFFATCHSLYIKRLSSSFSLSCS